MPWHPCRYFGRSRLRRIRSTPPSSRRGGKREAAELAYALAVRLQAEGRVRAASEYGRTCLALYDELPTDTIEQCIPTRMKVAGVPLPDYLHEDVVRSRLGHLL